MPSNQESLEIKKLPLRNEVAVADTWDLSSLYPSDEAWEQEFTRYEQLSPNLSSYEGTLNNIDSIVNLLDYQQQINRLGERLGTYAFLKTAEDAGNSEAQRRYGRFITVATQIAATESFIEPELLQMSDQMFESIISDDRIGEYALMLQRIWRMKAHTLNASEEKLIALQGQVAQTASKVFDQLTDVDMKFGTITDHQGQTIELSHATFGALLHGPKREVRKNAFDQYYSVFRDHVNTVAATLEGSIQNDVYYARIRRFENARQAALFGEFIPETVYDSLVEAIRDRLPVMHRYYKIRQRLMALEDIHMYDTYVPIIQGLDVNRSWDEAVRLTLDAVRPLGDEYQTVLRKGLTEQRWCDRYENRGKQSGAFSCGSFDGFPYILMNYQEDVLDHVFTLAHEAGHSMHSYFSARNQTYLYHGYELFVAEVASTFNEQLLHDLLMKTHGDDPKFRAYLINRQIDAIRSTIFRQTMFAEFERDAHKAVESGEPLTVELARSIYRQLLDAYFGPEFAIDDCLELECFRIPHFYRGFYVYKYATGLSAAIALSRRVLDGGEQERQDYLGFLKGGSSKEPLDLLRGAGVDMESPIPVKNAMDQFEELVNQLDSCTDLI